MRAYVLNPNTYSLFLEEQECNMKIFNRLTGTFAIVVSAPLFAHSGHDHSAADAGLIHLLWLAPIIIAAGIAVYRELIAKKDN